MGIITMMLFGIAYWLFEPLPAAHAAPACGPRASVIDNLARLYDEAIVHRGTATNGAMIEVLASPEGETWTILVSGPTGIACVVAAGARWVGDIPAETKDI